MSGKKQIIIQKCDTHNRVKLFNVWKSLDDKQVQTRVKQCEELILFKKEGCDQCQVEN